MRLVIGCRRIVWEGGTREREVGGGVDVGRKGFAGSRSLLETWHGRTAMLGPGCASRAAGGAYGGLPRGTRSFLRG